MLGDTGHRGGQEAERQPWEVQIPAPGAGRWQLGKVATESPGSQHLLGAVHEHKEPTE